MENVLIMAGGRSSRMRSSTNSSIHKALLAVFDVPLIELNLLYAVFHKFNKIWISIAAAEEELINHVKQLRINYMQNLKIDINIIIEKEPLGTIGAAQFVGIDDDDLLVLNVDNLLNLDLNTLLNSHLHADAVMTIASHHEPFKVPFGQLVVQGNTILDYLEKPEQMILVSSGTYVLSRIARDLIREDYKNRQIDIPHLCKDLLAKGLRVHSFFHESIWIDINDNETLKRMREMKKWPLIDEIIKFRRELNLCF
ncbi:MAG: hypothetical protein EOO89_13740 [Pedobacter sp.]|nr:MAG: hypothetical protein EOO89_13740 [Pedobacter sp.]